MKFYKQDWRAEERKYADADDFRQVFTTDKDHLDQLALLLGEDPETAKLILAASRDESVKSTGVFRDWASNWVKHTVIKNAIRIVSPRPHSDADFYMSANLLAADEMHNMQPHDFEPKRILSLNKFDRFVFVITVLEHYSDHDCALLLDSYLRDVRHARLLATRKLTTVENAETVPSDRAAFAHAGV